MKKSRLRAKIRKKYKGKLPTPKVFDPFLNTWVYYNKNGRAVAYRNHRWEAI